jgi:peptide deformylase
MVLPIVAYGSPILRKLCKDIDPNLDNLQELIADMWETMYYSNGVGLAAPQVNRDIRLFVIDSRQIFANKEDDEELDYPDDPGFKGIFINARIIALTGTEWVYNEGCLSIPKIREDVYRPANVVMTYQDEHFDLHTREFTGLTARILLHEYDHIEGKLFIDYLKPLKRKLLARKLSDISRGRIKVDYRMQFPL